MVDRGADLARIQQLHKQDAFGRFAQREVLANDGRRFATHLQRHRAEIFGGSGHHRAAGIARAGEHQVVKFKLRKLDAHAAGFVKEREFVAGEVAGYFFLQQGREVARVFGHLDHGAVARRKGVDQAGEAQVDGEVPRHDGADHAQRLRNDAVAGAKEVHQVDAAALRLHPGLEVFEGVVHAVHHRKDFGKQSLVRGAVAVVLADGVHDSVTVVAYKSLQLQQVGLAFGQRGGGVGHVGGALEFERVF